MTGDELRFRAALSRFGVGVVALVVLPAFYPRTRGHLWVWAAYLAIAGAEQIMIRKRLGDRWRAFASGLVDIAMLTYTVHSLGSVVTPMVSLYFFAVMANTLVVGRPVAFALAGLGVVAYDALVWAEWLRLIAFAPDVPDLAALGPPSFGWALMASMLVTMFVPASAATVAALVGAVQQRETLLLAANSRLEELSQLDPLTNLYNRRHLFARLEGELARVRRGHTLALVMIDLDSFKKVNDTQGHLRGDELLKEIASALAGATRASDVAGRYGGDEFVVILPDTDAEQAARIAERLARSVREAGERFDAERPVTASVGVAVALPSEPPDTATGLLRRADQNAYRAKLAGGDRVVG